MATILLVEHNDMHRDMLARCLERRGYQVVSASDGGQGPIACARLLEQIQTLLG